MTTRWIEGMEGDVIVVDHTHFPIVVATWFGAPTEPTVRAYFAWLDELLARAQRDAVPLVNITDAGPAAAPTADVRRLIADLTKAWGQAGADALPTHSYVVLESAAMRGVLTALSWLHGSMKTTTFATCAEALQAGIATQAHAGKAPPPVLDPARWQRPAKHPTGSK